MTWRHVLGLAALRAENGCIALVGRLATWRQQHAPETLEPPPPDLWPAIQARILAPSPPPRASEIVGFCCGQLFTDQASRDAHAQRCRATFAVPVILPGPWRREGRA